MAVSTTINGRGHFSHGPVFLYSNNNRNRQFRIVCGIYHCFVVIASIILFINANVAHTERCDQPLNDNLWQAMTLAIAGIFVWIRLLDRNPTPVVRWKKSERFMILSHILVSLVVISDWVYNCSMSVYYHNLGHKYGKSCFAVNPTFFWSSCASILSLTASTIMQTYYVLRILIPDIEIQCAEIKHLQI